MRLWRNLEKEEEAEFQERVRKNVHAYSVLGVQVLCFWVLLSVWFLGSSDSDSGKAQSSDPIAICCFQTKTINDDSH